MSAFGTWTTAYGLPAFAYTADQESDPRAEWDPVLDPLTRRHFVHVGNRRITLVADNYGLSDLFDVPLAQEVAEGKLDAAGTEADVPALVGELVPEVPATWWEHEELTVDGVEVSWWVDADGAPHAATFDGLAKALAWAAGRWDRRHVIRAVLNEPDRSVELLVDAVYD